MIVLDTNVISEFVRLEPDAEVIGWIDSVDAAEVHTTAITVAELLYGVARLPAGRRRRRLSEAIEGMIDEDLDGRVWPFDMAAARRYATLVSDRDKVGRPISVSDAQIAAICIEHHASLATRNTGDFEGLGIELVDPWRQA